MLGGVYDPGEQVYVLITFLYISFLFIANRGT